MELSVKIVVNSKVFMVSIIRMRSQMTYVGFMVFAFVKCFSVCLHDFGVRNVGVKGGNVSGN